jgi:hypothetical protein
MMNPCLSQGRWAAPDRGNAKKASSSPLVDFALTAAGQPIGGSVSCDRTGKEATGRREIS